MFPLTVTIERFSQSIFILFFRCLVFVMNAQSVNSPHSFPSPVKQKCSFCSRINYCFLVVLYIPHVSKWLGEFFRESKLGSLEFPFKEKMCDCFPVVSFTGLYKKSTFFLLDSTRREDTYVLRSVVTKYEVC